MGSIPGLGRFPGEGHGYALQYSGLENSMDSIVHGVAKSWTGPSGSPFPSLRCDHPASRVQYLPELPRVTSGSGRVSVEATGISMFLHVCVCIIMHVCRDICVMPPTHMSGGRQEPTPVLVACEFSRLETQTEPVCREQPCTLVLGARVDILGAPRLPPALWWRRLHPLCRLEAIPPCAPVCVSVCELLCARAPRRRRSAC